MPQKIYTLSGYAYFDNSVTIINTKHGLYVVCILYR